MMAGSGDDDGLAALHEQVALASSAAISASDLDYAFQLQLFEAIQASLRGQSSPNAAAASSSASPLPFRSRSLPLMRPAPSRSRPPTSRWRSRTTATPRPATPRSPSPPSRRTGGPLRATSSSARFWTRPPPRARTSASFPRAWRAHGHGEHRDTGPIGEVVLRMQKPVEGSVGGRMTLEVMALMEGLDAALGLGIRSVTIVTDYGPLHNHMLGIWHPTGKKLLNMFDHALSVRKEFEKCEISLVEPSQVGYVVQLARESIYAQIAKALAVDAFKEKRETCTICLEDTDVTKIHVIEGCAHRFCFSCMKEHVKAKLFHGMLPACPQEGCTTKLTVEGSKIFLSGRLLEIMVQRVREGLIPLSQKIYCPYPKCSALMSLSEVIHPMQDSSSKYTVADVATLRKCVKCRGSFCMSCKVPWHDGMTCCDYKKKYPHALPEDARLHNLAKQQLWRQCVKCKHMIELAEGCYHMTCVCGYEFCYTCGKEWKDKKATCSCPLWDEHYIMEEDEDDI